MVISERNMKRALFMLYGIDIRNAKLNAPFEATACLQTIKSAAFILFRVISELLNIFHGLLYASGSRNTRYISNSLVPHRSSLFSSRECASLLTLEAL